MYGVCTEGEGPVSGDRPRCAPWLTHRCSASISRWKQEICIGRYVYTYPYASATLDSMVFKHHLKRTPKDLKKLVNFRVSG